MSLNNLLLQYRHTLSCYVHNAPFSGSLYRSFMIYYLYPGESVAEFISVSKAVHDYRITWTIAREDVGKSNGAPRNAINWPYEHWEPRPHKAFQQCITNRVTSNLTGPSRSLHVPTRFRPSAFAHNDIAEAEIVDGHGSQKFSLTGPVHVVRELDPASQQDQILQLSCTHSIGYTYKSV
ncbi:hypothetical protein CBL_10725 [Carabus blaptoides fortunei]